jgi:hypothetical protein
MPLYDMAQMTVASAPGTGPITLGAAAVADGITYLTFAQAGALNADILPYRIADPPNWEIGQAPYTAGSPPILGRGLLKSSTGSLISASAAALVSVVPLAESFFDSTAGGIIATTTSPPTLTAIFSVISTCPVGGQVNLMAPAPGANHYVHNGGANPLTCNPGAGVAINNQAAAAPWTIQPNLTQMFKSASATQWYTVP